MSVYEEDNSCDFPDARLIYPIFTPYRHGPSRHSVPERREYSTFPRELALQYERSIKYAQIDHFDKPYRMNCLCSRVGYPPWSTPQQLPTSRFSALVAVYGLSQSRGLYTSTSGLGKARR